MPRKSRTRKRKNDSSTRPADDAVVPGADRAQTAEPDGSNIDPSNAPDPSTAESIDQPNAVCCWERSDSEQPSILGAVDSNTQLLEQLLAQVSDLREVVDNARHGSPAEQTDPTVGPPLADAWWGHANYYYVRPQNTGGLAWIRAINPGADFLESDEPVPGLAVSVAGYPARPTGPGRVFPPGASAARLLTTM